MQMRVLGENVRGGPDVQPRIQDVNFVAGNADHQRRVDRVTLYSFGAVGRKSAETPAICGAGSCPQFLACLISGISPTWFGGRLFTSEFNSENLLFADRANDP
jgi:hypothetical protein